MNPVMFTDAALKHIQNMLAKNPKGIGFRLSIKKTGCSGFAYVPDIIEERIASDIHFLAQDGLPVFIDESALSYLQDIVVDYGYLTDDGNSLQQKRLLYTNPKEKGRCGCGESFTI